MSTSVTVYNLVKRDYFYLDRAWWLSAPTRELLTPRELRKFAFEDARKAELGVKGWLETLMAYIENDGVYVAITDSDHDFVFFTTFERSEKNL